GEKAREMTGPLLVSVCRNCSVAMSQSLIASSKLPMASILPSGENAAWLPELVNVLGGRCRRVQSHTLTVAVTCPNSPPLLTASSACTGAKDTRGDILSKDLIILPEGNSHNWAGPV